MAGDRNGRGGGAGRALPRLLYTILETAEMLRIGRTKMYELIGVGEIKSIHIDRVHLIEASAIDEFLEKKRNGDDDAAAPPDDEPSPPDDEPGPTDDDP